MDMKKPVCLLLLAFTVFTLCTACKKGGENGDASVSPEASAAESSSASAPDGTSPEGEDAQPAAAETSAQEDIPRLAFELATGSAGEVAAEFRQASVVTPEEEAKISAVLNSLPPDKLDLYADQDHYQWVVAEQPEEIDGQLCYNVQALNPESLRREIMGNYYVSADAGSVYKYDLLTGENVKISL